MRRRQYILALLIGSVIGGCVGTSNEEDSPADPASPTQTPTRTPSPTASPTSTSTPTPTPTPAPAPEILAANLVSDYSEFGDVKENRIEEAESGAIILVGMRYSTTIENGAADTTEQVEIYNSEDARVAIEQDSGELLSDTTGTSVIEHALSFDTRDWGIGNFRAAVLVRDNHTGKISPTITFSFDLI